MMQSDGASGELARVPIARQALEHSGNRPEAMEGKEGLPPQCRYLESILVEPASRGDW